MVNLGTVGREKAGGVKKREEGGGGGGGGREILFIYFSLSLSLRERRDRQTHRERIIYCNCLG